MTDRPSAANRTRVALRIASDPGPAYLAAVIDSVLGVDGVEVVLVIAVDGSVQPGPSGGHRRTRRLDRTYDRLERLLLPGGPDALASAPVPTMPPEVRTIRAADVTGLGDAMRAARTDILVDLMPDDAGEPPPIPPGGTWRLRFADRIGGRRRSSLSRPAASSALAESLLEIDLPSGERFEAEAGVSAVHRFGFGRSRDAVYWRSALLPARRLARLVTGETVPSNGVDRLAPHGPSDGAAADPPGSLPPFIGLAARLLRRAAERIVYRSGWIVMVRRREHDQAPPSDLTGFRPIHAPEGRFFADPFVVATADGPRLYVEDCPDGAHRGRISVLRPDEDAGWTMERVLLEDLDHRAYPHALPVEGGLLLTPDGGRSGGVDLFLETGAPEGPQRIGHCLDGVAASDPTVLWHEGRYWLFVTVTGPGMSPWDELHLYSAEAIAGVWHPHPRNPVVADVRRARPAGRIFRNGAQLIRPGQDCSVDYGRRIVLSAISSLSQTTYEEHPIGSIEPTGMTHVGRTHTYSFDGSMEALDGYRRVLRRPWRDRSSRRARETAV